MDLDRVGSGTICPGRIRNNHFSDPFPTFFLESDPELKTLCDNTTLWGGGGGGVGVAKPVSPQLRQ